MIHVSDMKRGLILDIDDAPWQVIDCAFQTPSARGASTLLPDPLAASPDGSCPRVSIRPFLHNEAVHRRCKRTGRWDRLCR